MMANQFLSLLHVCAIAALPLLLSVSPSLAALQWHRLNNSEALCNDFSRAGYFLERNDTSSEWIIFLESGGLCFSPDTCNERFFASRVRRNQQYASGGTSSSIFSNFNTSVAWARLGQGNVSSYINPYVTSVETFSDKPYFNDGLAVNGTDLFDRDCSLNPFCNFNMVLVPYCSSDVWLGNDTRSLHPFDMDNMNDSLQDQFLRQFFRPDSNMLQFTFRGRVIFHSVIEELAGSLSNATDVILAGSSAGGVGAVNNAQWLRQQLPSNTNLSIISDSSWFVNFKDVIYQGFNGSLNNVDRSGRQNASNVNTLLDLISDIPQCLDTSHGPPCCLSLSCMLQEEQYFPKGEVPTIALTSLYDVFLLAYTINRTVPIGAVTREGGNPSLGLDFLTTTAEYGGVMNSTLRSTSSLVPNHGLSYIATHCLQHIYLVTSSLWGENGSLLGSESETEIERSVGQFQASFV